MGNCKGSLDEKTTFMDDVRDRFPDAFENEVGRRLHYVCIHGFGDPKDPIPAMDHVPAA